MFFTTYIPATQEACTPLEGRGRLYAVKLADATAVAGGVRVRDLGAGIPAGPLHLGDYVLLPGGGVELEDFYPDSVVGASPLLPSAAPRRYRVYWREPAIDAR